jgi:hypothetical protein
VAAPDCTSQERHALRGRFVILQQNGAALEIRSCERLDCFVPVCFGGLTLQQRKHRQCDGEGRDDQRPGDAVAQPPRLSMPALRDDIPMQLRRFGSTARPGGKPFFRFVELLSTQQ